MKKILLITWLSLLCVAVQAKGPGCSGIYICDGYFSFEGDSEFEDFLRESYGQMEFHTLCRDAGSYRLVPTRVSLEFSTNECTGQRSAAMRTDQKFIAILGGLPGYNIGVMEDHFPGEPRFLEPHKQVAFVFAGEEYILRASCDREEPFDPWQAKNYRLYLQRKGVTQLLVSIDALESALPHVVFVGDLDGDGLPDLILQQGYNYEYHHMVLYLSSCAGSETELVKEAASHEEWRDC